MKLKLFFIGIIFLVLQVACRKQPPTNLVYTEAELGKVLFFDTLLSRDSSLSCSSCHNPTYAFSDAQAFSKGVFNQRTGRNTPSAMNLRDRNHYFWDGRAATLAEQALGPIENPIEMDLPISMAVRRLKQSAFYSAAFYSIYGTAPNAELLGRALEAYQNTLETSNSAFDRYMNDVDTIHFSEAAERGHSIFLNKGKCFDCHFGPDFNGNDQFKNIGLYNGIDKQWNDEGRYLISGQKKDLGKFKIPSLRNVAITAPYMHNGQFKTLRAVIDFYNNPDAIVKNAVNRDTLLRQPLGLSETEKKDLEAFLLSLTDEQFVKK